MKGGASERCSRIIDRQRRLSHYSFKSFTTINSLPRSSIAFTAIWPCSPASNGALVVFDGYPAPPPLLRDIGSRAAATSWIDDEIARIGSHEHVSVRRRRVREQCRQSQHANQEQRFDADIPQ